MLQKKACVFTGHRPMGFPFGYDEQDERCLKLKQAMTRQISALIQREMSVFYTGMAQGVDLSSSILTRGRLLPVRSWGL